MMTFQKRGITRIEFVVVIVCLGISSALSTTLIHQCREDARAETCRERMKEIVVAAHQYADAHSRLPPATLGSSAIPKLSDWDKGQWRDHQFTSSLALTMDIHGMDEEYNAISHFAFDYRRTFNVILDGNGNQAFRWFGELKGFPQALKISRESAFLCPADAAFDESVEYVIGVHPVLPKLRQKTFDDMWVLTLSELNRREAASVEWNRLKPFSRTSYLACVGAHSGGDQPDPELSPYDGVMSTRDGITLESIAISDGLSRTIMYGESIGEFNQHKRSHVQTFFLGGLARGRGLLKWQERPTPSQPLFGHPIRSSVYGFGSMHVNFVNFAFCDGAVHSINREMDDEVFNQMCGMNDGAFPIFTKYIYVE